jgi:hypothetical protein
VHKLRLLCQSRSIGLHIIYILRYNYIYALYMYNIYVYIYSEDLSPYVLE